MRRILTVVSLLVLAVVAACSGSTSSTLPPTTGILIRAETLTGGKGCGSEPSQIFKYAVVVYGFDGAGDPAQPSSYHAVVTSNVFDCYTDGAFISLPAINDSSTFRLEVFAYNRAAYDAARSVVDTASVVGRARTADDRLRLEALSGELLRTSPTWTTQCSATQQENVQALASCRPLGGGTSGIGGTAGPTSIVLDTASFRLPDGRTAACTNVPSDAGAPGDEAGAPDAGDAGSLDAGVDAGTTDAGATDAGATDGGDAGAALGFAKVRVRTRIATTIVADTTVPCPGPTTVEVGPEPATYQLDVGLVDAAGNPIDPAAVTLCEATTASGRSTPAVCP